MHFKLFCSNEFDHLLGQAHSPEIFLWLSEFTRDKMVELECADGQGHRSWFLEGDLNMGDQVVQLQLLRL